MLFLLLFSADWNWPMPECLGDCGKEQQPMNQGQSELYSKDFGVGPWWPERELGMASAREGC